MEPKALFYLQSRSSQHSSSSGQRGSPQVLSLQDKWYMVTKTAVREVTLVKDSAVENPRCYSHTTSVFLQRWHMEALDEARTALWEMNCTNQKTFILTNHLRWQKVNVLFKPPHH